MKYKAQLRRFDLVKIEGIVRYSTERYFDTETGQQIVIGSHDNQSVMIPYGSTSGCYHSNNGSRHNPSTDSIPN